MDNITIEIWIRHSCRIVQVPPDKSSKIQVAFQVVQVFPNYFSLPQQNRARCPQVPAVSAAEQNCVHRKKENSFPSVYSAWDMYTQDLFSLHLPKGENHSENITAILATGRRCCCVKRHTCLHARTHTPSAAASKLIFDMHAHGNMEPMHSWV